MNLDSILSAIQEKAAGASPLGKTLKFNFGDQQLYIDGTQGTNAVSLEDKDADCTIKISQEDFQALITGNLNPMMAMMSGKIKIDGDMGVAMKLQSLIS